MIAAPRHLRRHKQILDVFDGFVRIDVFAIDTPRHPIGVQDNGLRNCHRQSRVSTSNLKPWIGQAAIGKN